MMAPPPPAQVLLGQLRSMQASAQEVGHSKKDASTSPEAIASLRTFKADKEFASKVSEVL